MTRQQIEAALDAGKLFARMNNGRYWQCRRNGRTQLWKTRPNEFRIPFKVGLKECGQLTHLHVPCFNDHFEIRG